MNKNKTISFLSTIIFLLTSIASLFFNVVFLNHSNASVQSFEVFNTELSKLYTSDESYANNNLSFNLSHHLINKNNNYYIDSETFSNISKMNVVVSENEIIINNNNSSLKMQTNSNYSVLNNKNIIMLENVAFIENNKFYVPIIDTLNALNFTINFNQNNIEASKPYATKRLMVKSKNLTQTYGAINVVSGYKNINILQYASETDTKQALNKFLSSPNVIWAHTDSIITKNSLSNTENFNSTLIENNNLNKQGTYNPINSNTSATNSHNYLNNPKTNNINSLGQYNSWGADYINVNSYKNYLASGTLSPVIVAVIDTGINTSHSMFSGRISSSPQGYNVLTDNNNYEDDEGHGTHVSGTIAELTPTNVKILPIKALDENGGAPFSAIWAAVEKVTSLKLSGHNSIKVINMSLGGHSPIGSYEQNAMADAINDAYSNGILTVVAAGNTGGEVTIHTPANVESAITVSAIDSSGNFAYFSSRGSSIDIAAPGQDILSAGLNDNDYIYLSGTSMASPHVAGAVALLFSDAQKNHSLSAVENIIKSLSTDAGAAGWDPKFGHGVLNLQNFSLDLIEAQIELSNNNSHINESFYLNLSINSPNTEIYYSTDRSDVENEFILYNPAQPILINKTTFFRAFATVKNNNILTKISKTITHVYIYNEQDLDNVYEVNIDGELIRYSGVLNNIVVPTTNHLGQVITAIESFAFDDSSAETITLPFSVTEIKNSAFNYLTSLTNIIAPNVETIGTHAFIGTSLISITSTNFAKLKTIEMEAFADIPTLQEINLPSLENAYQGAFALSIGLETHNDELIVNLPSLEYAYYLLFASRSNLKEINLNVKEVKFAAFHNTGLVTANFPNLVNIEYHGFSFSNNLQNLFAPQLETIGFAAFENTDIKHLNIPNAKLINANAFYQTEIETINAPNLEHLLAYAFTPYMENTTLQTLNLPNVKQIGNSAFQRFTQLKNINLPKVENIYANAFGENTSLEYANTPNVRVIGNQAFESSALTEINLPNIEKIEDYAFNQNSSLSNIHLSANLSSLGNFTFNNINPTATFYGYGSTLLKNFILNENYTFVDLENSLFNYETINNNSEIKLTSLINPNINSPISIPSYINNLPVTVIGENAFNNITAPIILNSNTLKTVESNAFSESGITYIKAPNLKQISDNAFNSTLNLSAVTIPSIEYIGKNAFLNTPNLTEIEFLLNTTIFAENAVGYLTENLVNSNFKIISNQNSSAHNYATNNNINNEQLYKLLTTNDFSWFHYGEGVGIYNVRKDLNGRYILPSTIDGIPLILIDAFSFENIYGLKELVLPSSLTLIYAQAFWGCSSLETINLEHVKEIHGLAFAECTALSDVVLENISTLWEKSFNNNSSLETLRANSITNLPMFSLNELTSLKNIYLNNIETINDYSFYRINNNANIFIGKNLIEPENLTQLIHTYNNEINNITIYGYSGTAAQNIAQANNFNFVPLTELTSTRILENNLNIIRGQSGHTLTASSIGGEHIKYEWYVNNVNSILNATKIENNNSSILLLNPTNLGTYYYFVKATNWDDTVIISPASEVEVLSELTYNIYISINGNGTVSPSQNTTIRELEDYEVFFTPNTGSVIDYVLVNGQNLGQINSYNITSINKDYFINVYFKPITFTINTLSNENGTIYPNSSNTVNYGESITLFFLPNEGYEVDYVLVNGEETDTKNHYTFNNVISSHAIEVGFKVKTYKITLVYNSQHGLATTSNEKLLLPHGSSTTLNITPSNGYYLSSVTINNQNILTNNVIEINNITENKVINIQFSERIYSIYISVDNNGKVSPEFTAAKFNENKAFEIKPNKNFVINKIIINGQEINLNGEPTILSNSLHDNAKVINNMLFINNISKNHTIIIEMKAVPLIISPVTIILILVVLMVVLIIIISVILSVNKSNVTALQNAKKQINELKHLNNKSKKTTYKHPLDN